MRTAKYCPVSGGKHEDPSARKLRCPGPRRTTRPLLERQPSQPDIAVLHVPWNPGASITNVSSKTYSSSSVPTLVISNLGTLGRLATGSGAGAGRAAAARRPLPSSGATSVCIESSDSAPCRTTASSLATRCSSVFSRSNNRFTSCSSAAVLVTSCFSLLFCASASASRCSKKSTRDDLPCDAWVEGVHRSSLPALRATSTWNGAGTDLGCKVGLPRSTA
mmetsp:Transcript_45810/g.103723  ORF Transcript_45810/g.103723 Transcript_45810/m.103723 type:complete len:220 (+) Transcript_45810:617-1276(+)